MCVCVCGGGGCGFESHIICSLRKVHHPKNVIDMELDLPITEVKENEFLLLSIISC